jgi:hypothetical protein
MQTCRSREYTFLEKGNEAGGTFSFKRPATLCNKTDSKKLLKNELMKLFQRFGYLNGGKDYEVNIRTTSGNVAWININSLETIK